MESLFGRLKNDSYLAHICPGKSAESLQEHTAKVVERACWLIGKHGLEKVVDRLIPGIAGKYSENVQEELKRMFMWKSHSTLTLLAKQNSPLWP